ncbi:glycosyltransferase [Pluralibacter gergoviae]|nr:glycosyltransferase [Pluralibacter gergoviae]ELW9443383.1 glycosyltransferase [Pluralibacter gergoviae]
MNKLLYISMLLEKNNYGGSVVSRQNLKAIKANSQIEVAEIAILKKNEMTYKYEILSKPSRFSTAINNLKGFAGRLNPVIFNDILCIIQKYKPTVIYLDSSMLGIIAEYTKKNFPHIKIVTFFHNVERDFELERLKNGKVQFAPSLYSSIGSERKAAKYSDVIITLHRADSERLEQLYNRKADFLIPVCIGDDPLSICDNDSSSNENDVFHIGFIGTAFFANIEAAKFISDKISPRFSSIPKVQFIIAGNGFESYVNGLSKENVKVCGYVESLPDFYNNIDAILSPITSGAGMKVKIAEALKFNKRIIASEFSLIGYEQLNSTDDITSCKHLEDYIRAIENLVKSNASASHSRDMYLKYFSDAACASYFKRVLSKVLN